MPKGISIKPNSAGIPVFWLHYSAKHDRDDEWVRSEKPKYSEAMWAQEQEMDFGAAGGERVLRDLLEKRWQEIVITDPGWQADPAWLYGAGLDYGKSHPSAFEATCIDFHGCRYALAEHYQSGNQWTPAGHSAAVRAMRARFLKSSPLVLSVVPRTICDPSMGYQNVATDDKFTSVLDLFVKSGFMGIFPGIRGGDLRLVDEIRQAWSGPEVKFKILCRDMPFPVEPGSMKKREGTYEDGCPNLLWELLNLRRKEYSAAREESVGAAEGLVDKDNDAWDALKYWWTSQEMLPRESEESLWAVEMDRLKQSNPAININALVFYRAQWKKKHEALSGDTASWR